MELWRRPKDLGPVFERQAGDRSNLESRSFGRHLALVQTPVWRLWLPQDDVLEVRANPRPPGSLDFAPGRQDNSRISLPHPVQPIAR